MVSFDVIYYTFIPTKFVRLFFFVGPFVLLSSLFVFFSFFFFLWGEGSEGVSVFGGKFKLWPGMDYCCAEV